MTGRQGENPPKNFSVKFETDMKQMLTGSSEEKTMEEKIEFFEKKKWSQKTGNRKEVISAKGRKFEEERSEGNSRKEKEIIELGISPRGRKFKNKKLGN